MLRTVRPRHLHWLAHGEAAAILGVTRGRVHRTHCHRPNNSPPSTTVGSGGNRSRSSPTPGYSALGGTPSGWKPAKLRARQLPRRADERVRAVDRRRGTDGRRCIASNGPGAGSMARAVVELRPRASSGRSSLRTSTQTGPLHRRQLLTGGHGLQPARRHPRRGPPHLPLIMRGVDACRPADLRLPPRQPPLDP